MSPQLPQLAKNFRVKKDSCIDFKLGKENVMNGKTESVEQIGSTKVSMGNNLFQAVKPSKFTRAKESEKINTNN